MNFYYGGKFNPITRGHLSVIDGILENIKDERFENEPFCIIIGIKGDDLEGSTSGYSANSFEARRVLVEQAVIAMMAEKWKGLSFNSIVSVVKQTHDRTWDYFHSKPDWYSGDDDVTLVLGEDEYKDLKEASDPNNMFPKWKHAQEILNTYKVISFPRDSFVSSTRVRELFRANPFIEYNEVSDYITREVFDAITCRHMYWYYGNESYARRTENEFLMSYDMNRFPRPSVTATLLVIYNNKVLLVRRGGHPYRYFWALPGGFLDVDKDETIEDTALRELEEETGLGRQICGNFEQFHVYSQRGQDPRGRIVDVVFLFDASRLDDPDRPAPGDDACETRWWPLDQLPRMAFHHKEVVEDYLREKAGGVQ